MEKPSFGLPEERRRGRIQEMVSEEARRPYLGIRRNEEGRPGLCHGGTRKPGMSQLCGEYDGLKYFLSVPSDTL